METRANYVIVGIFTIAAVLAAFAFVYWTAAIGDRGETALLRFRIPGSASGLARGSAVLFNGVRVGDIERVYIDVTNPSAAIADAQVDRQTPLTRSTQAVVGLAGLTGTANIEMNGGNLNEPNLFSEASAEGRVAEMVANPSAVTNLLQTAQQIFERTNNVLDQVEGFTKDARQPLVQTVENAQKFTDALAQNADGIDKFLTSVSALSEELAGLSGKVDGVVARVEGILNAVDPNKVTTIVNNAETFSRDLSNSTRRFDEVIAQLEGFTRDARGPLQKTLENAQTLSDTIVANTPEIDKFLSAMGPLSDDLGRISGNVDASVKKAQDLLNSVDDQKIASIVDNADTFSKNLTASSEQFETLVGGATGTLKGAQTALARLEELLGSENAQGVIAQATETLKAYRQVADNINSRMTILDDASKTLAAYRQVADTMNSRIGGIMDGISRFSGQGLREVQSLVQDSQRSINRIQESISDLSRNPQRIITGGEGSVRQYDGRARR